MKVIRFTDVGRDKRSWDAPLPFPPENADAVAHLALQSVRKERVLMSGDVEVEYDEREGTGVVVVGGFRVVGSFTVIAAPPQGE